MVAVNTRMLIPGKLDGTGWFAHEVLRRWVAAHPEVTFHFLFDRPYKDSMVFGSNVVPHVVPPPARHPLLWKIWNDVAVPRKLKKIQPQVYFSPDGFVPKGAPCPTLSVIHDLNFIHNPGYLPAGARRFYVREFPKFALHATHIATVSAYSKADLVNQFGVAPEKITVAWNGILEDFFVVEKNENPGQYFLFVGSLLPRKNVDGLLRAHHLYLRKGGTLPLHLVGQRMHWTPAMEEALKAHGQPDQLIWIPRLEGKELARHMAEARALILPSHFEGFGIPLAEAMACGTAVIAGNNTSMPEVVADAGLLIDSHDDQALAEAMLNLEREPALAQGLGEKGRIRARQFSWDQTANQLWEALEKALHG